MKEGLQIFQTVGGTASPSEPRANLGNDFDFDKILDSSFPQHRLEHLKLHQDEEDGFQDSAIGTEPSLLSSKSSRSGRYAHRQAPFPIDDTFVMALPQTLPSFSAGVGVPSISAVLYPRESKP